MLTKIKLPDLAALKPKLEILSQRLSQIQDETEDARKHLATLPPDTDEHLAIFQDALKEVKALEKEVEGERTSISKPVNALLRSFNGVFKNTSEPLTDLKRLINSKILEGNRMRETAREAALAEVQAAGGHVSETIVLPTQAKPVTLPPGIGREVILVEVLDPAQVPREYCSPDTALIRDAAKLARKRGEFLEVPGVRIMIKESGT